MFCLSQISLKHTIRNILAVSVIKAGLLKKSLDQLEL